MLCPLDIGQIARVTTLDPRERLCNEIRVSNGHPTDADHEWVPRLTARGPLAVGYLAHRAARGKLVTQRSNALYRPCGRRAITRRPQPVQLQLGIEDGVADSEACVAQSRCSAGEQQRLDGDHPGSKVGEARFNQFCSG